MNNNIVELNQIIERVNEEFLTSKAYAEHRRMGTLDQYYNEVLTTVAVDMITLPVKREIKDLEPLNNPRDVLFTMHSVADVVSTVFGKNIVQVQKDLVHAIESFPAHDIRTAIALRHANKLH